MPHSICAVEASILRALWLIVVLLPGIGQLAGCVYEPVPVYTAVPAYPAGPSNFERAWSAALGGLQDAGVQVTSADPSAQLIRGNRSGIDVAVVVARQVDGSVRVQFNATGPTQLDPGLADRFSQAYERRMGR